LQGIERKRNLPRPFSKIAGITQPFKKLKTGFFQYAPETKFHSLQWISPEGTKLKKTVVRRFPHRSSVSIPYVLGMC